VTVELATHASAFVFVQLPVYQRVNGLQLEPAGSCRSESGGGFEPGAQQCWMSPLPFFSIGVNFLIRVTQSLKTRVLSS